MSGNSTGIMVETRNTSRSQETMESLQTTIEEMRRQMEEMRNEMMRMSSGEGTSTGFQAHGGRNGGNAMTNQYGRMSKIEFPRFNGDEVQSWLFRCKHFFNIEDVQENMKVALAAMHLSGKAQVWHEWFIKKYGEGCPWHIYAEQALKRFGNVFEDPMVELKNLKQVGTVQVYQDQFEELLNRVDLPESVTMSLFIGGLKDEIGMPVRMFKPITLSDLFTMARMQEASLAATKPRYISSHSNARPSHNGSVFKEGSMLPKPINKPLLALPATKPSVINKPINRRLTQQEYADKRAKNLCFYCDQKYTPGHKCEGQLFTLMVVPEVDETDEFMECLDQEEIEESVQEPQISLNALTGVHNYKTLRIKGTVGKHKVHILVDCGSTHNFVDINVAKKLGCKITSTCPMAITVGDGYKVASSSVCKNFKWQLQGVEFCSDVMLLKLGGCEMVLGIQWLEAMGDMKFNFRKLMMEFVYKGHKMVMRGTPKSNLEWMNGKKQVQTVNYKEPSAELRSMQLCVYPNSGVQLMRMDGLDSIESPQISAVVQQYSEVFEVPKELPPQRSHDHRIPLIEGAPPVNIRPYRHPPTQKDAIESMVAELLEAGVIRPSHSPFASPIVMVKKKDNSWRMCVDYRQLM